MEHLYWQDVDGILGKFRDSGVPWLVISVPYQGFQGDVRAYFNRHTARQMISLKSLKFLKKFKFDAESDRYGHKWEVGYRGYGLKVLQGKLKAAGFKIHRREFTSPCRSVFFVLDNTN